MSCGFETQITGASLVPSTRQNQTNSEANGIDSDIWRQVVQTQWKTLESDQSTYLVLGIQHNY